MGMFDNPSAGKFDPPPGSERFEPPSPERRGRWILAALGLAYLLVEQFDHWQHPRGIWGLATVVAMVALVALEFVARRKIEPDEHNPFSNPTHITR